LYSTNLMCKADIVFNQDCTGYRAVSVGALFGVRLGSFLIITFRLLRRARATMTNSTCNGDTANALWRSSRMCPKLANPLSDPPHCGGKGAPLRAIRSVLQYSRNSLARQVATLDAMSFVDTVLTRLNSCTAQKMTKRSSL
jgi:hypothetical protein